MDTGKYMVIDKEIQYNRGGRRLLLGCPSTLNFQVLPASKVERGDIPSNGTLEGAASNFSQTSSGVGIQSVRREASEGSLLLMAAGCLNVQTYP